MSARQYRAQVRLLVRLLPLVAAEPDFALKGGTAINLFWRDLPRLSVWARVGLPPAANLPAVQWKLQNLATLSQARRSELADRLKRVLGL